MSMSHGKFWQWYLNINAEDRIEAGYIRNTAPREYSTERAKLLSVPGWNMISLVIKDKEIDTAGAISGKEIRC
jgi:hypothetical protein